MTTHTCPDCGASHRQRAPKKDTPRRPRYDAATTDLDTGTCRDCQATILTARIGGLDRHIDPHPINELGWRTYRGAGRTIYVRVGDRADVATPLHRWPPQPRTWMHVGHRCEALVPDVLTENNVVQKERTVEFPNTPDF